MEELDKVKPTDCSINLGGRERKIRYTFSVWAKVQEEYKGFKNFVKKIEQDMEDKPFTTIPHLLWLGLEDKEGLDESTMLDELDMRELPHLQDILYKALYGSLPTNKKK